MRKYIIFLGPQFIDPIHFTRLSFGRYFVFGEGVESRWTDEWPCRTVIEVSSCFTKSSWTLIKLGCGSFTCLHMGVFLNWWYPNSWMVYKGQSQSKMDDLGVPLFHETSITVFCIPSDYPSMSSLPWLEMPWWFLFLIFPGKPPFFWCFLPSVPRIFPYSKLHWE